MNKPRIDVIDYDSTEKVFNFIKDDLRERLSSFKGKEHTTDVLVQIRKQITDFYAQTLDKDLFSKIKHDISMKDPESSEMIISPGNLITGMLMFGVPVGFVSQVKDDCKEITINYAGSEFDGCKFRYTKEDGFTIQPKKPAEMVEFELNLKGDKHE